MSQYGNKQTRIKMSNIIVTLLIGLIGLIAAISSVGVGIKGQYGEIGPGFFPMSLGIVIFVLALIILWNNFKETYNGSKSIFNNVKKVSTFFVILLITLTLMEIIGFFGAMFLFTIGFETFIQPKKKPWWVRIVSGLVISGGIQLMFSQLMVQLPGPFWM
ncbi:tripartite tricarboxylate transporter TctB family protein [Ammoniphilus resinae]|uniref:Membrane protein n=1 Tax=Ammoniphilus resinae TaxID=861532 RepID=A0ABS4GKQ1_9BACL|nr:tripartite tricarboxylate transporter TctB family protein [Ammoniphilus resinae]MBP1930848.1 putative membrane protein [Ammoniphilus resinae]